MRTNGIDGRVLDLYDDYCHGRIDRRAFFARAAALFQRLILHPERMEFPPCLPDTAPAEDPSAP